MHTSTSTAAASPSTTKAAATKKMAVRTCVYSSSRKGVAVANGNGHAANKDTCTVILRPDQAAHMLDNNSADGVGQLVTVPVSPPKDKVFECPEESLFYCQCIESMVLNRCVLVLGYPASALSWATQLEATSLSLITH